MTGLARLCEHGFYDEHEPRKGCICPGGTLLPPDTLKKAWIGETNVDEVSDLVWDEDAEVIDVSKMDPVWVIPFDALAAAQPGREG